MKIAAAGFIRYFIETPNRYALDSNTQKSKQKQIFCDLPYVLCFKLLDGVDFLFRRFHSRITSQNDSVSQIYVIDCKHRSLYLICLLFSRRIDFVLVLMADLSVLFSTVGRS